MLDLKVADLDKEARLSIADALATEAFHDKYKDPHIFDVVIPQLLPEEYPDVLAGEKPNPKQDASLGLALFHLLDHDRLEPNLAGQLESLLGRTAANTELSGFQATLQLQL